MEFLVSGPIASLAATFLLGILLLGCLGAGNLVLSGFSFLCPEEHDLFSIAIGIILIAHLVLAAGLLGILTAPVLWGLTATWGILGLGWAVGRASFFSLPKGFAFLGFAFLIVILFLSWMGAVAPPIGTDALSYHLTHPKIFLENQRIFYIPGSRESLWPYLTEMLFTLGLAISGTGLATLFHWIFFPLTAWALFLLGKRLLNPRAGQIAALVFVLIPAAFAQSTHAYVDLSMVFYVLMALYGFLVFEQNRRIRDAFLCGLLCGGALGVKYLALGAPIILAGFFVFRREPLWKALFSFMAGCLLAAGVWYFRSWLILKNPVYPFLPGLFGGHGHVSDMVGRGAGMGPVDFALLVWNLTLHPIFFGGEITGPFFLMFFPLLFFRYRRLSRPLKLLTVFAVAYAAFLFTQSQTSRFFLPVTAMGCLGVGAAVDGLFERKNPAGRCILILICAVSMIHLGIFVYRTRDLWGVVFGKVTARQYLLAHERSFKGYAYLSENVKPGQKVFNAAEPKYFYSTLDRMVMGNSYLRRDLAGRGLSLESYLEKEDFDYLWLLKDLDFKTLNWALERNYAPVYAYDFFEKPAHFHYVILKRRGD